MEGECSFASRGVKARKMALHEEGKETQSTAVSESKFLSLKSSLVRYCEMSVLRDLEMDCGVNVTSKPIYKYLAQQHKLTDNPAQYHLFQEGFGSPHQLLLVGCC